MLEDMTLEEMRAFDKAQETSLPTCPICGGLGFNAAWMHTDCHNKIAAQTRTPIQKTRKQWERLRGKLKYLVIAEKGEMCVSCGNFADTIDHIIPISKGGTNELTNLQPMCMSCNGKKKARIL